MRWTPIFFYHIWPVWPLNFFLEFIILWVWESYISWKTLYRTQLLCSFKFWYNSPVQLSGSEGTKDKPFQFHHLPETCSQCELFIETFILPDQTRQSAEKSANTKEDGITLRILVTLMIKWYHHVSYSSVF